MVTRKDIGLNVRTKRKEKNLKQWQLAKKINPGLTETTISRIESGHTNFRINTLYQIAEALDCHIEDFIVPSMKISSVQEILKGVVKIVIEELKEKNKKGG
jgi:transcriptional regulator with XRE-family HTH domain